MILRLQSSLYFIMVHDCNRRIDPRILKFLTSLTCAFRITLRPLYPQERAFGAHFSGRCLVPRAAENHLEKRTIVTAAANQTVGHPVGVLSRSGTKLKPSVSSTNLADESHPNQQQQARCHLRSCLTTESYLELLEWVPHLLQLDQILHLLDAIGKTDRDTVRHLPKIPTALT